MDKEKKRRTGDTEELKIQHIGETISDKLDMLLKLVMQDKKERKKYYEV